MGRPEQPEPALTLVAPGYVAVERRPEQALHVATPGQRREQRPVPENRSRPGVHALDREARLEIEELELLGVDGQLDFAVGPDA